jgi:hypothetical protein
MEVRYFGSNPFDEFFDAANDKRIHRPRYVRYGTDKIGFFRIYLDCARRPCERKRPWPEFRLATRMRGRLTLTKRSFIMNRIDGHPRLSLADRQVLIELIVESDGVTREQALAQIESLATCDLQSVRLVKFPVASRPCLDDTSIFSVHTPAGQSELVALDKQDVPESTLYSGSGGGPKAL